MTYHSKYLNNEQMESVINSEEAQNILGKHALLNQSLKVEQSWQMTFEDIILKLFKKHIEFAKKFPNEKEKIAESDKNIKHLREISNRMFQLIETVSVKNSQLLEAKAENLQLKFKVIEMQKEIERQKLVINE